MEKMHVFIKVIILAFDFKKNILIICTVIFYQ